MGTTLGAALGPLQDHQQEAEDVKKYYEGLQAEMTARLNKAASIKHGGGKGTELEEILKNFLATYLPQQYSVSKGMAVSSDGQRSTETDVIIHDRHSAPNFYGENSFVQVPIEVISGVISVKATLNRAELKNAMEQVASVRQLPQNAVGGNQKVLRPRAFIFGFKSDWQSSDSAEKAFSELANEFHDDLRPNGVCILNQTFMIRTPYTTTVKSFPKHELLRFFLYLLRTLDTFPKKTVLLERYFAEYSEDPP